MTFKELNDLLAQRAEQLCAVLLPGGKREGREWVAGSTEGGAGHSLKVPLEGPKLGRWKDFASDEGGDLLKLIEETKGMSPKQAADFARDFLGLAPWAPDANTPPPFDPLRFGFKRREETEWRYPTAAWCYHDAKGTPLAWVARFDLPDGSKDVMPIRMVDGKPKWKGYTGTEKRPLYNLHRLHARPEDTVLVVEGEKTADAAAKLFPDMVVVTWMGGTANVSRADWFLLLERRTPVVLWADADKPGRKAMAYVGQLLPGSKRVATADLPEKWDLADPVPDGIDIRAMVDRAMAVDPVAEAKAKEAAKKEAEEGEERYHLPHGCDLSKVEGDILKYGVFEHRNQVFTLYDGRGQRGKWATEVSNCTVQLHQHIITKDGALALVTLRNQVEREAVTMDVPFDAFSTSLAFVKLLGNRGNFQWWGTDGTFTAYKRLLMDRMGKGRIITELGGQPEGFFVFNNAMVNGSVTLLDRHGCFQHEGSSYYVPSGNAFYMGDDAEFSVQKRMHFTKDSTLDFGTWNQQLVRCYGEHAYMASVFAIATAFSGYIFDRLDGFPMLFLHGPGGSGKDQLIKFCQGLFGRPQPEIFLSGPNTDKGLIKMFAEFNDIPLNLAEYRNGLKKDMDELLKSLWGRIGYRLAAMRGKRTETIPIRCSAYVTGNDYPNRDNALMRRLLIDEVEKKPHTAEDITEYGRLQTMAQEGYSHLLADIYKHRPAFLAHWHNDHYKPSRDIILEAMGGVEVDSAILMNMQVLLGTRRFFQDKLPFAFSVDDMAGYMAKCMKTQLEKRSEGSEVANFWTCFVYAQKRGHLVLDRDYKCIGNAIQFFWGDVFAAYAEAHQRVFGEKGERPSDMRAKLERHPCYMESPKSARIGHKNSSAIMCDMDRTGTNLRQLLSGADKFSTDAEEAKGSGFMF